MPAQREGVAVDAHVTESKDLGPDRYQTALLAAAQFYSLAV
jgi:hypothetical protein